MSNLRDKNDRAIRAFIRDAVKGVNGGIRIYISMDPVMRKVVDDQNNPVGLVDVKTVEGPEAPAGSGNYTFMVMVRAKMPMVTQPDQGNNDNRALLGKLVDAVFNQLHLSDNGQDYAATSAAISAAGNLLAVDQSYGTDPKGIESAEENADMEDYSCLAVIHNTAGGDKFKEENEGLNFLEVITFRVNIIGTGGYWN